MNQLSHYLPEDFDANAPLAVLAGKGEYPITIVNRLRQQNINVKLVAFEDETASELFNSFASADRVEINVGQLGKLLKSLKKFGAKYAMMAGQITPKKLFKGLTPDLKAITILATLKRRNAETIFGAIAEQMSKIGVTMLDGRCFIDDCVAPEGFFCGKKWNVKDHHLEHAMHIARESARLDIGQSCVTAKGTVLAVEAFEGTDKMIERAGTFEAEDAIFAKTVKPNQDYRFDIPVIGERTIRKLAQANIHNVALEAGKVIMINPELVRQTAENNNIKIFGVK